MARRRWEIEQMQREIAVRGIAMKVMEQTRATNYQTAKTLAEHASDLAEAVLVELRRNYRLTLKSVGSEQ